MGPQQRTHPQLQGDPLQGQGEEQGKTNQLMKINLTNSWPVLHVFPFPGSMSLNSKGKAGGREECQKERV